MKKQKLGLLLLEIFGVVLFLLFLSPIFLLVVNSAKSSANLASPLSWPASFGQLWTNAVTIWNNPSIKYPIIILLLQQFITVIFL